MIWKTMMSTGSEKTQLALRKNQRHLVTKKIAKMTTVAVQRMTVQVVQVMLPVTHQPMRSIWQKMIHTILTLVPRVAQIILLTIAMMMRSGRRTMTVPKRHTSLPKLRLSSRADRQ